MKTYDERVPLASVNLDRVHDHGLVVDRVRLDHRHVVPVDREREVRVACHRHQPEPVPLALRHVEHRQVARRAPCEPPQPVDQRRVRPTAVPQPCRQQPNSTYMRTPKKQKLTGSSTASRGVWVVMGECEAGIQLL